ncbi:zinc finger protein ZAT9-like [Solanum tuberosum]|uniref:zinc finger protein ZAT9-like n=1 Tax=Solanum tuberosum TaxID=4113 RepID=UPI00073A19A1|nr:PREDICTED: zinc finger protein ZAT9-like [Solanum tuberosum]
MEAEDDQENNGSCEKGLSSSNFKVKINLKLKKNKDESCGDEDVREEKNLLLMKQKKDHICCECGKEFSSGKALGGHMKEEEIGDVVVSCEICHKNFPSKKSLFGHMRCHPDREWRGMKPPSKKISKNKGFRATFEDVNEGFEDCFASLRDEEEEEGGGIHFNVVELPPLKDWGAKDRRGRSPLKRSVSSTIMDDDKELHDAVQQLISLVNGDVNNNNNNNNRSEVMMSSSNSVGSAPKEAAFRDLKDKSKKKGVVDGTKEKNREETKKRKREKELVKLEPGQDLVHSPVLKKSVEVKYKCNECGRMFATHQALGGHRSSHNKFKISIENTIDGIKDENKDVKTTLPQTDSDMLDEDDHDVLDMP